jgi:hypothetical protein
MGKYSIPQGGAIFIDNSIPAYLIFNEGNLAVDFL